MAITNRKPIEKWKTRKLNRESGQGLTEYGLLLLFMGAALATVIVGTYTAVGNRLEDTVCGLGSMGREVQACVAEATGTGVTSTTGTGSTGSTSTGSTSTGTGSTGTGTGSTSTGTSTGSTGSNPNNAIPTANFTHSCNQLECTFTSTSSDSDGSIVVTSWDFGDGGSSDGILTTYTFGTVGTYTVEITVIDSDGGVSKLSKDITVNAVNNPPVASFVSSCNGLICNFNGSASYDGEDSVVSSYTWDFDGASGSGTLQSYTFSTSGTYEVTLTVTDSQGLSDSLMKTLVVSDSNSAPQASFSEVCNNLSCEFDASGSSDAEDPDGDLIFTWNFGDGSPEVTGSTVTHVFDSANTYSVQLLVQDTASATDSTSKSVTVSNANAAPTATITDLSCTDLTCTFQGTGNDADGTIASYLWTVDGSTYNTASASHTFASAGSYTVSLIVTDNDGTTSSPDTRTASPTAPAPGSIPVTITQATCNGATCTFNATVDTNGNPSWVWNFGDGNTSNTAGQVTHTYSNGGSYTVMLQVTKGQDSGSDTEPVNVVVNQRPNADFSTNCSDLQCTFTSTSTDSDGSITNYAWQIDGQSRSGQSVTYTFGNAGSKTVQLTVTDDDGAIDTESKGVTVSAASGSNNPPVVQISGLNCYSGSTCQVSLNGAPTDSDGSVTGIEWDFGDGTVENTDQYQNNRTHTYSSPGQYTATVTATDDDGAEGSDTIEITTLHMWVGDVDVSITPTKGQKFNVNGLTLTIVDPSGARVSGANYQISGFSGICTTNSNGQCTVYPNNPGAEYNQSTTFSISNSWGGNNRQRYDANNTENSNNVSISGTQITVSS